MEDARDIVGETVLVSLRNNEGFTFLGIPEEGPFFCNVVAVDEIGIWVENKKFQMVELTDSRGRSVPKKKRKPETHIVNILLPWREILSVVRFTESDAKKVVQEVIESIGEDDRRIGFIK